MKKIVPLVLIICFIFFGQVQANSLWEWEEMAPLPEPRVLHAVVADSDGSLFVVGGSSDAGGENPTNTLFRYDTAHDTWEEMKNLPAALHMIDAEIINGKIYIPGDQNNEATYVYDINGDNWSSFDHNNGYTSRILYRTVSVDDTLFVLGGYNPGIGLTNTVWMLCTDTNEWSEGVSMQNKRANFAAGVINKNIYVAGGVIIPGFIPVMTGEIFTSDEWAFIADVPDQDGAYPYWSYMADGYTENSLWIAGGRRDREWGVLNHAGYYDPAKDIWKDSSTSIPTLNQGRVYLSGAVASDGYFYATGGRNESADVIYDSNERLRVVDYPALPPDRRAVLPGVLMLLLDD